MKVSVLENFMMETMYFDAITAAFYVILFNVGIFYVGRKLYKSLRQRCPSFVNCWFCNTYCIVPYTNNNSWECYRCEQYNGFLPDGSYNKTIPAQYDEDLNQKFTCQFRNHFITSNGLCAQCNRKQTLKVRKLVAFTPSNPSRFDQEVDIYKLYLEEHYKLCATCEDTLKRTISQQEDKLVNQRRNDLLQESKARSFCEVQRVWQIESLCWSTYYMLFLHVVTWLIISNTVRFIEDHHLPVIIEFPAEILAAVHLISTYEHYVCAVAASALPVVLFLIRCAKMDILCSCLWILVYCLRWTNALHVNEYKNTMDLQLLHLFTLIMILWVVVYATLLAKRTPKCHERRWSICKPPTWILGNSASITRCTTATEHSTLPHLGASLEKRVESELNPGIRDLKLGSVKKSGQHDQIVRPAKLEYTIASPWTAGGYWHPHNTTLDGQVNEVKSGATKSSSGCSSLYSGTVYGFDHVSRLSQRSHPVGHKNTHFDYYRQPGNQFVSCVPNDVHSSYKVVRSFW